MTIVIRFPSLKTYPWPRKNLSSVICKKCPIFVLYNFLKNHHKNFIALVAMVINDPILFTLKKMLPIECAWWQCAIVFNWMDAQSTTHQAREQAFWKIISRTKYFCILLNNYYRANHQSDYWKSVYTLAHNDGIFWIFKWWGIQSCVIVH